MYGVIFNFLKEYVVERHGGNETWQALLKANGNNFKLYLAVNDYPDEEIVGLAKAASEALSVPLPDVLEDFGSYVGPRLMSFYPMYLSGHDKSTFDIIEYAGGTIHDEIHRHNPDRKPPLLRGVRESDNVLMIHYHSHRKLCPVVRGIVRGLAEHFGENVSINETQCLHHGGDECLIKVTKH